MTNGNIMIALVPIVIIGGSVVLILTIQYLLAKTSSYDKKIRQLARTSEFEMEQYSIKNVVLVTITMLSSLPIGLGLYYFYVVGIIFTIVSFIIILLIALFWKPKSKLTVVISTEKIEFLSSNDTAFYVEWKTIKEIEFSEAEYHVKTHRYIPSLWEKGQVVILRGNGCERKIHLFSFSSKDRLIANVLKFFAEKLDVRIVENPEMFTYPEETPLLDVLSEFNPLYDLKQKQKISR